MNKDDIKAFYIVFFGAEIFPLIEKAIDDDGWYCSEKNDLWLKLEPHHIPSLSFRNGNKDFIPTTLLNK